MQVYASLSPVVHIVNIESAATESLANVSVCVPQVILVCGFVFPQFLIFICYRSVLDEKG